MSRLIRIETSDAYSRFLNAFRQYNANCPVETHERKRTTKDGDAFTQTVPRKVGILKESLKVTFYNVLTEYIYAYNTSMKNMPEGMYTQADPPGVLTNCVHLAWLCDCSDRTVRNHLDRLRELGFIRTKFRGRKHDFQLWISSEILFGGEGENFEKMPQNGLPEGVSKNFPPNNTHREYIEKEKGNADLLIKHGENIYGERGRTDQGDTAPSNASENAELEVQRGRGSGGGRGEIVAANAEMRQSRANEMLSKRNPRTPRNLHPRLREMLVEFWLYAWKVVYTGRDFSHEQQEKAMLAIMAGVYNNFSPARSEAEWVDFQTYQLGKLDKAARYYDHHPDAYKPDPYAVQVAGKGYFDAENVKGFIGIDAWVKKDALKDLNNKAAYAERKEAKIRRCEGLLRTARRDFEKLHAGIKPRKEVAEKTEIGLFQYWKVIMEAQGDAWLRKFASQYIEQKGKNFEPPKYLKSKRLRYKAGEMKQEVVVYVEDYMNDGEGYYTE
ncbi:helix-turn-helix transcriptional regulator [Arundinibacter roseus]|uniref:Helix-turn-helix domain-containing protein n=1 Tax=Arundinibacter roseus TaxID=2070510 RepID=A0A4R4KA21_9BACT|nr:helix-turn-helix transcriptional regulator [Arundinibacter roseus]TDB64383.1 hypothetical protein EZE20_11915 [Arundinibacter roseus]